MKRVSVIIPAYKPDEKLIATLNGLVKTGFTDILVVDDGSGPEFSPVFDQVKAIPECTLLRHQVNRGKGAALKTAMSYFMDNRPDQVGVVTADADGQHLSHDISAVSLAMLNGGNIVLGVRDFSSPNVPPRSKTGNRITIAVFRLFFGMKISDTQTGLRAFPRSVLPELLAVKGDRYEFETHMLFHMNRRKIAFDEVKIETVYLEENKSSHFRAVRDSLRIYSLILKYLLASVSSAVIDEGAYFLFKSLFGAVATILFLPTTFISAFLARAISSFFQFPDQRQSCIRRSGHKKNTRKILYACPVPDCAVCRHCFPSGTSPLRLFPPLVHTDQNHSRHPSVLLQLPRPTQMGIQRRQTVKESLKGSLCDEQNKIFL